MKYKYYFHKVISKTQVSHAARLACITTIGDFTVRCVHSDSQQSYLMEAVNLFGVRPEEAGLSSRCVIGRIKCLVSAKGVGDSGLSLPKATGDSIWFWTFVYQIMVSSFSPVC